MYSIASLCLQYNYSTEIWISRHNLAASSAPVKKSVAFFRYLYMMSKYDLTFTGTEEAAGPQPKVYRQVGLLPYENGINGWIFLFFLKNGPH